MAGKPGHDPNGFGTKWVAVEGVEFDDVVLRVGRGRVRKPNLTMSK